MTRDEDFYKREEDKRWRDQVNDRISSQTASEVVQNDRLDALDETVTELKELLEGVAGDKNDNGLKGDIKELSTAVNQIRSVLSLDLTGKPGYDHTGKPGYLKKIEMLWGREERSERRAERWWKGIPALIVAIASLIGLVLTNLDHIEKFWQHFSKTRVESKVKNGKSGKRGPKKKNPPPVVKESSDESPGVEVP